MKNLHVLPLIALAVGCSLFGIAYSDAKVKSPSAMLMCLLFILIAGIGFWINSLQPCDKSKPGVEEQAWEKLRNASPSTPNWLQTLMNKVKFWWNSEDIDDLKDQHLLKKRNNSVPNISELEDKLNNTPKEEAKPVYNSQDGRNNTPLRKSQSLAHIPNYNDKKPGSSSPTPFGKFGSKVPSQSGSVSSVYTSLPKITNQNAASPTTKPPTRSMNDSLPSAEIGKWYLDSPADRKKSGQPSSGQSKNCRREIIFTAVCSTLITIAVIGAVAGLYVLFPDFFAKILSVFH